MEVPVKPRRPPSLPLICTVFPDKPSFSVLTETPMTSAIHFKKLKYYAFGIINNDKGFLKKTQLRQELTIFVF